MSTQLFLIIFFVVFFPLQVILLAIFRQPHEKNVEEWAKKERLKILNKETVDRDRTPFSWFKVNYSFQFYRIRALTETGAEKSGYLCVAGQFSPFFSAKVRAEWDREQKSFS